MSETLPQGWTGATLGELVDLVAGKTPASVAQYASNIGSIPWVKVSDMNLPGNEEFVSKSVISFSPEECRKHGLPILPAGSIIFPKNGGAIATGKRRRLLVSCSVDLNTMGLIPHSVENTYFYHWLKTIDLTKISDGTVVPQINKGHLLPLEVPLPPLAEQKRIVAKLDALLARSTRTREELARIPRLIERYKQAVLAAAFRGDLTADWRAAHPNALPIEGMSILNSRRRSQPNNGEFDPPYAIPETWRWTPLPLIGSLDRGKSRHRPRNDARLFGGYYPFIQTGEVRASNGYLSSYSQTYSEFGLSQSRLWPAGTLCITIAANIAETAILGIDACFPDSVVGFIPEPHSCSAEYVEFFIRTVKSDLSTFAPATAQKNINLDTLSSVYVPVPPLPEQLNIVESISQTFRAIEGMSTDLTKAEGLRTRLEQATLAKAFRGELVPQDPNDEPASVLLEYIRAEREANGSQSGRRHRRK